MRRMCVICALMLVVIASAMPVSAAKKDADISGWAASFISYPDSTAIDWEKTGMSLTRDDEEVADGLASLHIYIENQMDNLNIQASQNISSMEPGKTYRLTGKFKVPSAGWRFRIMFGNTQVVTLGDLVEKLGEWSDVEYVFRYTYSATEFRIQSCGTGDLYADNVSLQEVLYDEDGETVIGYGRELIANGGFEENLDLTPPKEVSGAAVANKDERAEISWTNPNDSDFAGVYIYDITGGGKRFVAETAADRYTADSLENGNTYEYLLQTFDKDKNISEGVTVLLEPVADAVKYTAPRFFIDGDEVQKLSAGRLKAQVMIKNNRMHEDYSAELILVLEKDGALYDIQSGFATVPTTADADSYTAVEAEIDVPEEEGLTAYLYVWDSVTGMEALEDYYIFE